MKKLISLTLCLILLFTNTSFGQTNNISDAIKDLEMVEKKINIMIDEISGDEPLDMTQFMKDIKFCESILASCSKQISKDYSNEPDIELKAAYSSLLYVSSLYALSLSSMIVYINNETKSNYFVELCATYKDGTLALNAIKSNF